MRMLKSSSSVQLVLEMTIAGRSERRVGRGGEGCIDLGLGEPQERAVRGVEAGRLNEGRNIESVGAREGVRRQKSCESKLIIFR